MTFIPHNPLLRRSLLAGVLGFAYAAGAQAQVAIALSKDSPTYQEIAASITASMPALKITLHIFGQDREAGRAVLERIRAEAPKVLVAVGPKAVTELVNAFPRIPLIYLAVIAPERLGLADRDNVYGVSWIPSPEALAKTIRALAPRTKQVGTLSSMPSQVRSSLFADFAKLGLGLAVSPVKDVSGVLQTLRELDPKTDLLWMGLDPVLANKSAFEILKAYTLQRKLPFLVPFEVEENSGVLAGISVSPKEAAAQVSGPVTRLLEGKPPKKKFIYPEAVHLSIDLKTADAIGLEIPAEALRLAAKVHGK